MTTKFFTNTNQNSLFNKLKGVFAHNDSIRIFDVLIGYFRASGYFKVRPLLNNVTQIRILVGINIDELTFDMHAKGLIFKDASPEQIEQSWQNQFLADIQSAKYSEDIEQGILQFVADVKCKKVEIRCHPSKNIHAKIYILRPTNFNEHSGGSAITGSSNLTDAGLGTSDNPNYEFNVLLNDYSDVKFATDEFEKLWEEGIEIQPDFVDQSLQKTYLKQITSEELYYKLLIEYFGDAINFNPDTIGDLPKGFMRLKYQLDAVEQGYQMLKKHNGFFLADVVGLGKTIIATLIAQRFYNLNNYPDYRSRVLVVCPPAVLPNWQATIDKFGLDYVTIKTNGVIGSLVELKEITYESLNYDLIIVDESHAFKNEQSDRFNQLQRLTKSACRDGSDRKKVILISATPMNNGPKDIYNQILLFKDGNDTSLATEGLADYFNQVIKKFDSLRKQQKAHKQIAQLFEELRIDILEHITVRRTRNEIIEHETYSQDLTQQKISFPKLLPPIKQLYQLNEHINALYDETVNFISSQDSPFYYASYCLIKYLKPEHKKDYKRADHIVLQLRGLMKNLLLKRLDSSFKAINYSLHSIKNTTERLIKMFDDNRIIIAPNVDIGKLLELEDEEKIIDKLIALQTTDPSIKILTANDFESELLPQLQSDLIVLNELLQQWQQFIDQGIDPKRDKLIQTITQIFSTNTNQKLVIFSESAVTTNYLEKQLLQLEYKVLAITANNREQHKQVIKENFDANYASEKQKNDFDIIIATETLAEGINLHRAHYLINYDTPWNSTRLMQRIGRINRIGSTADRLQVFNFLPTAKVEDDIKLQTIAQNKLMAFHKALGEDSQIYTDDEQVENFGIFDETIKEDEQVSERFKYLLELRTFKQDNPNEFKRIKDLPLKIRNAVAVNPFPPSEASKDEDNHLQANSTLCFLRNDERDTFYLVANDRIPTELSFFKAVPIFERHKTEPTKALPQFHYQQVNNALQAFRQQSDRQSTETKKLIANQQKAIKYLAAFVNDSISNDNDKILLNRAQQWIVDGRYRSFAKDVNTIFKNSQKGVALAKQLETILNLIADYQQRPPTVEQPIKNKAKPKALQPNIVISQTYV